MLKKIQADGIYEVLLEGDYESNRVLAEHVKNIKITSSGMKEYQKFRNTFSLIFFLKYLPLFRWIL